MCLLRFIVTCPIIEILCLCVSWFCLSSYFFLFLFFLFFFIPFFYLSSLSSLSCFLISLSFRYTPPTPCICISDSLTLCVCAGEGDRGLSEGQQLPSGLPETLRCHSPWSSANARPSGEQCDTLIEHSLKIVAEESSSYWKDGILF